MKRKAVRYYKYGWSAEQVGKKVGRSETWVLSAVKELLVKPEDFRMRNQERIAKDVGDDKLSK